MKINAHTPPQFGLNKNQDGAAEFRAAAPALEADRGKSAGNGRGAASIRDIVELRDPLDLSIGAEMLQSAIGKQIEAMFEEHGISLEDHVGQDMSVDATAERIVDFATGFYAVWKEQNPDADDADSLDEFEATIRGAIDQGYGEAIGILKGMESISEGVFGTAEQTYDRIRELLDERFAKLRGDDESSEDETQLAGDLIEIEGPGKRRVPIIRVDPDTLEPVDSAAEPSEAVSRRIDILA